MHHLGLRSFIRTNSLVFLCVHDDAFVKASLWKYWIPGGQKKQRMQNCSFPMAWKWLPPWLRAATGMLLILSPLARRLFILCYISIQQIRRLLLQRQPHWKKVSFTLKTCIKDFWCLYVMFRLLNTVGEENSLNSFWKRKSNFDATPNWDATMNHVINLQLNIAIWYPQRWASVIFQHTRQLSGKLC